MSEGVSSLAAFVGAAVEGSRTTFGSSIRRRPGAPWDAREVAFAVAVWQVARGIRSVVLADDTWPSHLATIARSLAGAVHSCCGDMADSERPFVLSLEADSALFVVHPRLLASRLASAKAEPSLPDTVVIDVCPATCPERLPRPVSTAPLSGLLTRLHDAIRRRLDDPGWGPPSSWQTPQVGTVPSLCALAPLAGWLLEYPAVYGFGPDLTTASQDNCLSGTMLNQYSVVLDAKSADLLPAQANTANVQLLSFTIPTSQALAMPNLHTAAQERVRAIAEAWAGTDASLSSFVHVHETQLTLDHVAL